MRSKPSAYAIVRPDGGLSRLSEPYCHSRMDGKAAWQQGTRPGPLGLPLLLRMHRKIETVAFIYFETRTRPKFPATGSIQPSHLTAALGDVVPGFGLPRLTDLGKLGFFSLAVVLFHRGEPIKGFTTCPLPDRDSSMIFNLILLIKCEILFFLLLPF